MSDPILKIPNFFIIGAPKCGTTSMYHYLRQHPDIFMPYDKDQFWRLKEPNYYASDLGMTYKVRIEKYDDYVSIFQQAGNERRIGEASPFYLYSTAATSQLKQLADTRASDVRILIMLRPPINMIQSRHNDLLRWGHENITSFQEAVEAQADRKQGKRIPTYCAFPQLLLHTEMGHYFRHVKRYVETFGRDNVHIVLLQDLQAEPYSTYKIVLKFLGVDPSFTPKFETHNESALLDSTHVSEQKLKLFLLHNARFVYSAFSKLSPTQQDFVRSIPKLILPASKKKPTTGESFISELRASYKPDIQQLETLLNRDLTDWYQ